MKHLITILFFLCAFTMNAQTRVVTGPTKQKPTTSAAKPKPKPTTPSKPAAKPKPATPSAQPEAAGYDVTITCNVASAELFIDGIANGTASGTRFLKTGSHSYKVTATGYEDKSGTFTVGAKSHSLNVTLQKSAAQIYAPAASQTSGTRTFTVNGVSFKMISVSGGTFQMGATSEQGSDAYDDEKPVHKVTLSDYYIGQTEVTQALWQAVMGNNPSIFKGDNLPVECVSWNDCQEFIEKLNAKTGRTFRLPTEAQWEFAARGGNNSRDYKYSGSNYPNDVAWYDANSMKKTHNVATKQANELGIYDMSGNVYEWCQDWYGSDYYKNSDANNPRGAYTGSSRVRRGGGWGYNAGYCRSAFRGHYDPAYSNNLGLRLAL